MRTTAAVISGVAILATLAESIQLDQFEEMARARMIRKIRDDAFIVGVDATSSDADKEIYIKQHEAELDASSGWQWMMSNKTKVYKINKRLWEDDCFSCIKDMYGK